MALVQSMTQITQIFFFFSLSGIPLLSLGSSEWWQFFAWFLYLFQISVALLQILGSHTTEGF